MKKEPTQAFLKDVYNKCAFFRDSGHIYQAEYSQAQKQYWYFPIRSDIQKTKGYKIINKLEKENG